MHHEEHITEGFVQTRLGKQKPVGENIIDVVIDIYDKRFGLAGGEKRIQNAFILKADFNKSVVSSKFSFAAVRHLVLEGWGRMGSVGLSEVTTTKTKLSLGALN